jgi:acyl dehydratase
MNVRNMPFRYFEDFAPGLELPFGPHTVSRAEIVAFAAEFDPQPFHLDEAAASETLLGGLAASGWHTCALFMRMMCDGWLLESASMGAPGIDSVNWLRPVRPGDVLSGRSIVLETRPSSRPTRGFVRFRHEVVNNHGETVMVAENPIMFERRVA